MAVKLIVLKSGENIIADINEMLVDGKTVGYYLNKACIVRIMNGENPANQRQPRPPQEKTSFDISLFPWIPLAKGTELPISIDWVITFVDPVDMLYEMYVNNVINGEKEWGEGLNKKDVDDEEEDCKNCR
jgi:hypothetical protein